jgi:hypothetical protein
MASIFPHGCGQHASSGGSGMAWRGVRHAGMPEIPAFAMAYGVLVALLMLVAVLG